MIQKYKFPKDFLWGAGTSAHQIEGNNTNTDWWEWENSVRRIDSIRAKGLDPEDFKSGIACDSYNRFDEDFALAESLGHNATRLSIEWARIEAKEGMFDEKAFDHYEKVLQSAKFHGLKTFVTLHHFTNPLWFSKKGGFENSESVKYFIRYAETAARKLSEFVDFWLTFNEPTIYAGGGYFMGVFPPNQRSLIKTLKVICNLITAHNRAAPAIKLISQKPVGLVNHFVDLQPSGMIGRLVVGLNNFFSERYIFKKTLANCDFIGVNYYTHHHVGLFGVRRESQSHHQISDIGTSIHPEGLGRVLFFLKKFGKPIYITENGIADRRDEMREKFIKDHLYYTHRAIEKGADVRGYLHWSLIDNFEWEKGFAPRFGLIEIDREDLLRRRVRYSALKYAEICVNNCMEY